MRREEDEDMIGNGFMGLEMAWGFERNIGQDRDSWIKDHMIVSRVVDQVMTDHGSCGILDHELRIL